MDVVPDALSTELGSVVLLFALFVTPRVLQRWSLPSAITSFALGAIAAILRDSFNLGDPIFGGLIVYAMVTTLLPGLVFRAPPPVFDAPELPEMQAHFPS